MIFAPLESLINLLSNDMTNSIILFFDIQLISLEHVTFVITCISDNVQERNEIA